MNKDGAHIFGSDADMIFPHFAVLKASAGSGKTHALTARYVQFLLSERIPRNNLRNMVALTFSNNAAREMRERILSWLKAIALSDRQRLGELKELVFLPERELIERAGNLIDEILDNYSDFQVKTIDSFMTSVFRASAIDFGYAPEFEILFRKDLTMKYAFDMFLKNVSEGTSEADLLDQVIMSLLESRRSDAAFLWNPSPDLLEEVKKLYTRLSSVAGMPLNKDLSASMGVLRNTIKAIVRRIEEAIAASGLERDTRSSYNRSGFPKLVEENGQRDIMGKGLKIPPVKKKGSAPDAYENVLSIWEDLKDAVSGYASCYARSFYYPALTIYGEFGWLIENVKKGQGMVFIEDINRYLAGYLGGEIVPDIYFRLGETIYHYLIDEFQDTSPVQWNNLIPLLENSLSQGGSLFVVGDTKQSIYGFRDADYRIMKGMEEKNPFPSARHGTKELDTNYRSLQRILDLNETMFHEMVPANEEYREAGIRSGLADYVQRVPEGETRKGYAEVVLLEKDEETLPEKERIQETVADLVGRGFSYGDIAILTQRNEDAVMVTTWLNEKQVDFISYSSLDIRRRKITGEIIALLNFLDSPVDDTAFAAFLLGDLFHRAARREDGAPGPEAIREFIFEHRDERPLYTAFRKSFRELWANYFSGLFRATGYLPIYDLVTAIFSVFRVFEEFPDEEAALVKVLEVIKEFEGAGYNSLRDFLEFAGDDVSDESVWNMDVPKDLEAVRVMTIHKAKGLGFPAVIVLLYASRSRSFEHIVKNDGEGYVLLRVTGDVCKNNPDFEPLYEEERLKDRVNGLNTLYVGLTRAKEELYVIGVKGTRDGKYPFDILPVEAFPPSEKPERKGKRGKETQKRCKTAHRPRSAAPGVEREPMLRREERERGEFIHEVLAHIEYSYPDLEKELKNIIRKVSLRRGRDQDTVEITRVVTGLVDREGVREFFLPARGRSVLLEQEFSDPAGGLYRMDRVIVDPDRVTVVDFKTGADGSFDDRHALQMKTYLDIVRDVFSGREARGIIAYTDREDVRTVE